MKKVRVGVIGAGAISNDHCGNVKNNPDAELVAIADLSDERRLDFKKRFNIPKDYADWKDLVADKDIDAVVIALPNSLHAPVSLGALENNKHVLLDKPFALNYAEAKAVADLAKKQKKVVMVGMNQRFTAMAQNIRGVIENNVLGEVFHAKASWRRRMGSPKHGTWFVNKKLSGGGCLLDIGVHALDLALHLMDNWEPTCVLGRAYEKFGHRGIGEGGWGKSDRDQSIKFDVDDFATALINFKNGATLDLTVSWVAHQESPDIMNIEFFGTEGGANLNPPKLFRMGSTNPKDYEIVVPQSFAPKKTYSNRQNNWIDTILGTDKPFCTVEQALVVQKLLDAIYESSKTGREVKIESDSSAPKPQKTNRLAKA